MDGTGSAAISSCVGIGDSALGAVNNTAVTGTIAIGQSALGALTSGASNLAIGYLAADAITSGGYSICIGESAGGALTGSNSNSNIAIGYQALTAATTNAEKNVAIGNQAMYGAWSTAAVDECVSVGYGSMKGVLTADATGTVAIGASALAALTSGARNTAVGYNALAANLTGVNNTVLGYGAMDGANGSEGNMIAIGKDALGNMDNNSSSQNIAIGVGAMDGVGGVVATNNIMIGLDAGGGTWTGSASDANVGIGNLVMDAAMDGALRNTGVGQSALGALTTGVDNVAVGRAAGDSITTGATSTIIGEESDGAATAGNQIAIGYGAVASGSNVGIWGNASVATNNITVDWTVTSDERIKKDIEDSDIGLSFINALKPRKFRKKHPSEWDAEILEERYKNGGGNYDDEKDEVIKDEFDDKKVLNGLIAQEVKESMDELDVEFSGWSEAPNSKQSIQYSTLVMPLIKAVQELSAQVEELKEQLENK